MKNQYMKILSAACLTIIASAIWSPVSATQPWTAEQIAEYERTHPPIPLSDIYQMSTRIPGRSLDDPVYFEEFVQTCHFLATLQNFVSGGDFGGMREGEIGGDFNIIQTDNTQEAIRDWSQYALWTGDTTTFSENVRAAWVYCQNFPAWQEESSGDNYYRDHNCGWGIEAVIMFREAYDDTSNDVYADACCTHMTNHSLGTSVLENYGYALGLGGLYQWAVIRNHPIWIDYAIQQGFELRTWLNASPATRIRGTSWALCGGTAVWGLCRSLFAAYPDTGRAWVEEYGSQIPTAIEIPASSWYNSFKAWNSNATFACSELSDDPDFINRVVLYAEDLLSFDVDDDGGIPPGTCCIDDGNDHSWVSAYMGWMALGNLVNGIHRFVSPNPAFPHPAGIPLTVVMELHNPRFEAVIGEARVIGFGLDIVTPFTIESGEMIELQVVQPWTLPDDETLPDENQLTMIVNMEYGDDTFIDTVTTDYDIRRQVRVTGTIRGEFDTEEMPPCRIEFSNPERPDTVYVPFPEQTGDTYSSAEVPIFAGDVRMRVIPPLRYIVHDTVMNIQPGQEPAQIDIFLLTTEMVLVDDDAGTTSGLGLGYETYIETSLRDLDLLARVWDQTLQPIDDPEFLQMIIWMTGGDSELGPVTTVIDAQEQQLIESFLMGGGKLIITGQDIIDVLRGDPFLTNVLHCEAVRDTNTRVPLSGDGVNPVFGNVMALFQGGNVAGNQYSPASMTPLNNAETILLYPPVSPGDPSETAAIAGIHGVGRFIFTGFGIEGLSSNPQFTSRTEFIELCMDWLNPNEVSENPQALLPTSISLKQNYPNPFNPSTTIQFFAPENVKSVSLIIYDILGQKVASLYSGTGTGNAVSIVWSGHNNEGRTVASGTYIYELKAGEETVSRTLKLLR